MKFKKLGKYLYLPKLTPYQTILICVSLLIVFIWFKGQNMLAMAEEGLPFYNLTRALTNYSSSFFDTGLGLSGALNIPRIPLFLFLSLLQKIGLASWHIQMFLFGFLIIVPLLTVPKLIKELMHDKNGDIGFIAALFYFFNLYVLSQVMTRFVYSLIFLWSYLPLFLLLWILYLKENKKKYLFFFLISSIIFSDVFVIISPLITLWFCAAVYFFIIFVRNTNKLNIVRSAVIAFVLWMFTNIWWLLPLWQTRNISNGSSIDAAAN